MSQCKGSVILVVDNEPPVLGLLAAMVAHHGYASAVAGSGTKAVEVYRERCAGIGAVILEVQMAGMDGPKTLTALREITPDLPCVFINGDGGDYGIDELLAHGNVAVLNKPGILRGLKSALDAAFYRRELALQE